MYDSKGQPGTADESQTFGFLSFGKRLKRIKVRAYLKTRWESWLENFSPFGLGFHFSHPAFVLLLLPSVQHRSRGRGRGRGRATVSTFLMNLCVSAGGWGTDGRRQPETVRPAAPAVSLQPALLPASSFPAAAQGHR